MESQQHEAWRAAPESLALPIGEIHVWRTALDRSADDVARLRSTLSADERARAERLIREVTRRHFIAGRGFLRATLASYVQRDAASLAFRYALHGKPELVGVDNFHFNLSHSAGCAILGVTRVQPLGVDVERVRLLENWEGIARRFFSAAEVAELSAVAAGQRALAFFNCWTRKEAYIKACGEGLARPLDRFVVSLTPGAPPRLLHVDQAPDEPARWSLRALTPYPGYVACVAIAAASCPLRLFDTPAGERSEPAG